MKCPHDGATLVLSERKGIEIDYCPECRGMWLDRGELDKMLEGARSYDDKFSAPSHHEDSQRFHKPKKRESFLGDLFDF